MARAAELRDLDADGIQDVLLHNRTGDVFFWGLGLGRFERDPLTPEDLGDVRNAGAPVVEPATTGHEGSVQHGHDQGAASSKRTPVPSAAPVQLGPSSRPGQGLAVRSAGGPATGPTQPGAGSLPSKLQTPALPAGSVLLWDEPVPPKGFQVLNTTVQTSGPLPSWSNGPAGPISWSFPWGGAVGHKLLVAEGSAGTAIRAYDATTQTWMNVPSLSQAIGNRGCAAIGDSLYCVGGAVSSASLTRVDVYDATTNTWSAAAPLPAPLHTMGVAAAGGQLYVFGGMDQGSGSLSDKIYSYDPGTNTWTLLGATLSRVRTVAAAATVGQDIFLFGGSAAPSFPVVTITWVEKFDSTTGMLTKLSSGGPQSSFDRGSAVVEGTDVHVFGFVNGGNTRHDIYDAKTDTWSSGLGPAGVPPLDIGGLVDGSALVVEQSGSGLHIFGGLAQTMRLIQKK